MSAMSKAKIQKTLQLMILKEWEKTEVKVFSGVTLEPRQLKENDALNQD